MMQILLSILIVGVLFALLSFVSVKNKNYFPNEESKMYQKECKSCKIKSCSLHPDYDEYLDEMEDKDD